ncbi:CBN-CDD-1 protein [Caenorhabditis brenneri]|uniref:CBN-CDD-1 protein n=1 Tax=Caenorhabditis brenneri TaxID=135651 RepID=G0NJ99_CAEBE|nr:CBN-CDD-1 protein [Caenorhabditis brenneri]
MTTTKSNLTEFEQKLVDKAVEAMQKAYCKYSNFKVGAALVCDDGEIIIGATELEAPCSPCGICRQYLIEHGDYKVILGSSTSDQIIETSTYELLPYAFTPKSLDDHEKETEERNHHSEHKH